MLHVRHAEPDRQTILGHLLASLLVRGLQDPRTARALARPRGLLTLEVSGMVCSIELAGDSITLHAGRPAPPRAELRADLCTLVRLATSGGLVPALLARRLVLRGRPWHLLPLLHLLRR
jgi:hypothetical protein